MSDNDNHVIFIYLFLLLVSILHFRGNTFFSWVLVFERASKRNEVRMGVLRRSNKNNT